MGTLSHCRHAPIECQWRGRNILWSNFPAADPAVDRMQAGRPPLMTIRQPAPPPVRRLGSPRRSRVSRGISLHPRDPADDVPGPAVDAAAVCRVRDRGRVQPALPLPHRSGRHRPQCRLRSADTDGLRLRPRPRVGRGRPRRRRHRLDRGHGGAFRRHPAREGVDVDDDQRDVDHPARALRRRREVARHRALEPVRHGPERHPQGVRRPRHLHLPAAAVAAHRHRHLRVLRSRDAELEHDLDQRLPHPRGRLDGDRGGRFHLRQRDRLRRSQRRRRARRQPPRPAAVVLLQRPQQLPRRDRQVPRRAAAVGADHARAVRRHEPARRAAALPHADGRQHADGAAARQQHRPCRDPGAGRGDGRNAVAALQRPRRGAGAADRGIGAHRTQDAADHRRRDRRREHRRSVRGIAGGRSDDGRDRARRAGAARPDRRGRRHPGRDRAGADSARDPGIGLPGAAGHRRGADDRPRRQRVHERRRRQDRRAQHRPGARSAAGRAACTPSAPAAIRRRGAPRSMP